MHRNSEGQQKEGAVKEGLEYLEEGARGRGLKPAMKVGHGACAGTNH